MILDILYFRPQFGAPSSFYTPYAPSGRYAGGGGKGKIF